MSHLLPHNFSIFQFTFPHRERHKVLTPLFNIREFQSTFPHGERLCRSRYSSYAFSVSIHVPARGTTYCIIFGAATQAVSIHVPARGTTCRKISGTPSAQRFQSTFPHGERPQPVDGKDTSPVCFNPRSRTGNDPTADFIPCAVFGFQSTFPHGERPLHRFFNFSAVTGVSIHVPARGTTAGGIPGEYPGSVSIHVPARGTTQEQRKRQGNAKVSIHVPARGTTA